MQCFPYGSSVASVPASDVAEAPAGVATAAPQGGKSDLLHFVWFYRSFLHLVVQVRCICRVAVTLIIYT